jgi:death on curing protein
VATWLWIDAAVARAIHDEQLSEHGGPVGVRDQAGLESAMARAQNIAAYGKPDLADLAAAYAFVIARDHPFVEGNKRTAAVVAEIFVMLNGASLEASDAELVVALQELAAGELSEIELADWVRVHLRV